MSTRVSSVRPSVFISHSHRDRALATDLQRVLTKYWAGTFLDQDKIQVADVLPNRIRQGIEWCDIFLLIWSGSATASDWVGKEWNMAYELRKKIVPYCLDSTPLPPVLENLVYIDRKDAQVAHVGLLRSVFGKSFAPPSTDVFPGRWLVTLNAFGLGTANYDLELRPNGQVTGSTKIDQSGVIGGLMRSFGASDLLNIRPRVSGTWRYEESIEMLTLDIAAHGLGQDFREEVQIRTTGREVGEIHGKDLSGRTYTIKRLPGYDLKQSLLDLEKTLGRFAAAGMTADTIKQETELVLASAEALESHRTELTQMDDAKLSEEFEKICTSLSKFKAALELNIKFATKNLGMKLFAEALRKHDIPKFRIMCF